MELINGLMSNGQKQLSAEEIIPTLCDRMAHARLASDKRAAILTLKGFSREYREQVVANGLRALIQTLREFTEDTDLLKATLETLLILFIRGEGDHDITRDFISLQSRLKNGKYPSPLLLKEEMNTIDQFSVWIADEITQDDQNIAALVSLLENTDFYIRLYTLQLLEALVSTRPSKTRDLLLSSPLGISSLVQVLTDHHDPVRNEAVLLLMSLANDNFNIQKLIAFENTFDRLFEIIHEEGDIAGSIVVQDCLTLLSNLLKYNLSNQKLFMETNCLPKLAYLIGESFNDDGIIWNSQRIQNIITTLDIVKLFVLEGNESTRAHQDALDKADIFLYVLRLSFSGSTPNAIRSTALLTVASLISSNERMQLKFSSIDVPYIDPSLPLQLQNFKGTVSVINALLNWCLEVNSVHLFDIRVAAAHLLKAYFEGNEEAKRGFIEDQKQWFENSDDIKQEEESTENLQLADSAPLTENSDSHLVSGTAKDPKEANGTVKHLKPVPVANIFEALLKYDREIKLNPYKIWFSSFILIHIIHNNDDMKHDVMKITSGNEMEGEEVITAIQSISELLVSALGAQDQRISIGYLQLLIDWLYEDSEAVDDFLKESTTVKALLTFLSQSSMENGITQGLVTILLGIAFEFSSKTSPVSRQDLHSLITKMLGKDNYGFKVSKFKENNLFSEFKEEDIFDPQRDETGLPEVFFDPAVVLLIKDNYYRIKNTLNQDPTLESNGRISYEKFEQLSDLYHDLKSNHEALQETLKKSQQETESLLKDSEIELSEARSNYASATKDLENLRSQHSELNSKHTITIEELEQLQNLHKSLSESSSKQSEDLKNKCDLLSSTTAEIESLKTQLKDIAEQKKKAEDGINKMSRELFQLTRSRDDLESQVKKLEKEAQNSSKQQEKLDISLKQKTTDLSNLNKKLVDLHNQLKTANKLKTASEKEILDLKASNESSSGLVEQLTEKLRSLALSHNELISEKESLEKKLEEAHNEFSSEIALLRSKVDELEKNRSELSKTIDRLRKENEELTGSLSTVKAEGERELTEVRAEMDQILSKQGKLKDELELAKESSKDYNQKIEELNGKLEESDSKLLEVKESHQEEFQKELEKHKTEINALERKLETQEHDYGLKSKALEEELVSLKEQKELVCKQLELNRDETAKLSQDLAETDSKLSEITLKFERAEAELISLKKAREELIVKQKSLEADIKEKNGELESTKKDSANTKERLERELDDNALEFENKEDEYKKSINALKETISSLESEKNTLSSSLEIISQRIESKDREYNSLFQNHKDKLSEVDGLHEKIKDLLDAQTKSEILVEEKSKEISSLKEEKHKLDSELSKKLTELKNKEAEIKALNEKVLSQKTTHQKAIDDLRSEIKELEKSIELRGEEFEKERALLSENSDSSMKEYSERVTKLEEDLKQVEKKNAIKVEVLNRQKEKSNERVEELELLNKKLAQDVAAKDDMISLSAKDLTDSKAELVKLKDEVSVHEKNSKRLVDVQKELKSLKDKQEKLKVELQSTQSKLEQKERKLGEVSTELESFTSSSASEVDVLKTDKSKIEAQAKALESKNLELEGETKSLRSSISELESLVKRLEEKNAASQKEALDSASEKEEEIVTLKEELSSLNKKLIDLESTKTGLEQTNKTIKDDFMSEKRLLGNEKDRLEKQVSELESKATHAQELESQRENEIKKLQEQLEFLKLTQDENEKLKKEIVSIKETTVPKGELDDLMLILDDLETQKSEYKSKAKELGAEVSSDEDEDEDDDEEEDEDEE